jgi:hypothetical protein
VKITAYNQHVSAPPRSEFLASFFHRQSTLPVEEPMTLCHQT